MPQSSLPSTPRDAAAAQTPTTTSNTTRHTSTTPPQSMAVARMSEAGPVSDTSAAAAAASSTRALITLSPVERRVILGAGRTGISIAEGLLLSGNVLIGPLISAAMVIYSSGQALRDYERGALNRLGQPTSGADVAMRVGLSLGTTATGIAIGQAVGALIGISAIPVAGQVVLSTVLSVGLGICVGTLLTRYVDRLFIRLQIRHQYHYPPDERGARGRFEQLLQQQHDLSTMETCTIVQHYADYRVASGWESANAIDDYRASRDVRLLPVSLQHFAVVQLQRKWGFLHDKAACRKVYKALLLLHHPDRGGSTALTAQLNADYEVYAFCQGWNEDCPNLLRSPGPAAMAAGTSGGAESEVRAPRRNVVMDFLRSLFRPVTNSAVEAEDLRRFGLPRQSVDCSAPPPPPTAGTATRPALRLPAPPGPSKTSTQKEGQQQQQEYESARSPAQLQGGKEVLASPNSEDEDDVVVVTPTSGQTSDTAVKQRSVARVLDALERSYQIACETITFFHLVQLSQQANEWAAVGRQVQLFHRLQNFLSVCASNPGRRLLLGQRDGHRCGTVTWQSEAEAVTLRDAARGAIVTAVFTSAVHQALHDAMGLWQSGKALAESYFRQCNDATQAYGETSAGQVLEALLEVQDKLNAITEQAQSSPWKELVLRWATTSDSSSQEGQEEDVTARIRKVARVASWALAGECAATTKQAAQEVCEAYFRAWARKRSTAAVLEHELQLTEGGADLAPAPIASPTKGGSAPHTPAAKVLPGAAATTPGAKDAAKATSAGELDEYVTQLLQLQRQFAEVDALLLERYDVCWQHFPEEVPLLSCMPSTCAWCIDETLHLPRYMKYERERTLRSYVQIQPETPSLLHDPSQPGTAAALPAHNIGNGSDDDAAASSSSSSRPVCDLLVARYVDPISGAVTPCWLKRYTFPALPPLAAAQASHTASSALDAMDHDVEDDLAATRLRTTQQAWVRRLLQEELHVSEHCCSTSTNGTHQAAIVATTEIFYERPTRQIFAHIARHATQERFRSVHDIAQRILPLGVRWLHDALQCLIELHGCSLSHGSLSLAAFTYDDFGNTALGFFAPASPATAANTQRSNALQASHTAGAYNNNNTMQRCSRDMEEAEEEVLLATPGPALCRLRRARQAKDVVDFAIMLLSEILPYMTDDETQQQQQQQQRVCNGTARAACMDARSMAMQDELRRQERANTARVFREVGERLIGKEEPKWTLQDARQFVRRCIQFTVDEEIGQSYFTSQEITLPAFWAARRPLLANMVCHESRVALDVPQAQCTILRNMNIALWEPYWRCRREMALSKSGGFTLPRRVQKAPHILHCSDEYEVNERYVWLPCASEEEAWSVLQDNQPPACNSTNITLPQGMVRVYLGIPRLNNTTYTAALSVSSQQTATQQAATSWGILYRATLGTVTECDGTEHNECSIHTTSPAEDNPLRSPTLNPHESKTAYAARRRCHLLSATTDTQNVLAMPMPWVRCYPEYLVHITWK